MGGSRPLSILLLPVLLACWSCDSTEPIENDADMIGPICIDNDGDSYGVNCDPGLDCDDTDATVWDTCVGPDRCAEPNRGCPCETEGEEITCRTSEPVVSPDGSTQCWAGVRTCVEGEWSGCEGMSAYDPPGSEDEGFSGGDGAYREAVLGTPAPCAGSCEASCKSVYDCPSSPDLTAANSTNIRYDLPFGVYAAAVIVDPAATTGRFARVIDSNCPAGTQPQWWSIDYVFQLASASSAITLYVKTADTAAGADMFSALGADYGIVAECPGTCTPPADADSRSSAAYGNIETPPVHEQGTLNTHLRYLGIRLDWDHTPGFTPPARFEHYTVYYFCDQAT